MVILDASGLPLAVHTDSASPHEVTLVQATLDETFTVGRLQRIIGDRAYNRDPRCPMGSLSRTLYCLCSISFLNDFYEKTLPRFMK